MPHGTEFAIIIVFALTLAIGAATRLFSAKTKFPYTIAMLVLGLGVGYLLSSAWLDLETVQRHFEAAYAGKTGWHPHIRDYLVYALGSVQSVGPDLIIFIFLPALIFESAYAIDLHTFKKTVGPAIVFAVPAKRAPEFTNWP